MEEITKMHVDWKKITVVGALVILTGLTVGGLTWYVADSGAQDEMEAYKNEISTLETKVAQLEAAEAPTDETATTTTTKKYTNTNYNYELTFGEKWKTYRAKENTELVAGEFASVAFQVPATGYPTGYNTMLTVTVMSKTRYDELVALGTTPTLVENTDTYYYTYSQNGAGITNDYSLTADDIKTVGESLTLTK